MRLSVAAIAICLAMVGISAAQNARAAMRKPTNIPAQPLGSALEALAKERDLQVIYRSDLVGSVQSAGAVGVFTPEQALGKLLADTGLTYRYLNDTTVTIAPMSTGLRTAEPAAGSTAVPSSPADTGSQKGRGSFWDRFLLAQAAPGQTASAAAVEKRNEQPSDKKPVQLEEVLVTAQKREERLIDVPISVVALTAEELRQRNITAIDDLSSVVPGLFIDTSSTYRRQITMRGIANTAGSSPLIGQYLDEADVAAGPYTQIDLRTYDLNRVEVLRGPQGTLYGEGSAGGTIRFITKNPVLDRFEMTADVAALFTQDGAPSQRIQEVFNAPLIENQLGLRIAGTFDHEGGWIDQPAAGVKDFNDQNVLDVRPKLMWQPTPELTATAMLVIHRTSAPPDTGEDASGSYTQVFNLTTTPSAQDDYDLFNLTLSYDFPWARLLSTTSYLGQLQETRDLGHRLQLLPPGNPLFDLYFQSPNRADIFTDELRLMSTGSGPWQWTVGGFYRRARLDQVFVDQFGVPGPPGTPLPNPFTIENGALSKSWAAFGDSSYKLTDRLTFGAGLRYFEDHEEDFVTPQTAKFHTLNPRVYTQYKLTDELNIYASAARGFRSGGFNALKQPTYGPESVWTYELGTKMSLAGGRFSADADIFYSDYTNYQIFGILVNNSTVGSVTSNGGSAKIKGAEWALIWHPLDQWSLGLNGDYMDAYFYKINVASAAYQVGDPLDYVPKYAYTISARRDFQLRGRAGYARLDYNSVARATYRNRGTGPWYFSESDVIHMLNFDANLQWNETLSLGLFAQNLLNDRGYTSPDVIDEQAARARPRTFGIQFGVKFH